MDWNQISLVALRIAAIGVLVFLNAFFVAAEFALVKIRDTQLGPLIRKGHKRARVTRQILHRLDSFLSAAQLGITLASLGLGWIGEPVFSALLHPLFQAMHVQSESLQHILSVIVGFSAITFLHISAGEQAPKWLAIQRPLPVALSVAYPMLIFYYVSYPFVLILNHTSQWMLRQMGLEPVQEGEGLISEDELRLTFSSQEDHGGAANRGRNLLLNALDLRHRIVREVMRPRHEITLLDTEATMSQCLDVAEKTRYSRFPLCEAGDLEKTRGVIHIKDLYAMRLRARNGSDLLPVARKLIYVPETARLEKLLHLFLDRKLHCAIVVDEYGGTQGMVTLENILEEVVGQIQDEFDQEKPLLTHTSETTWEIDGALPLHDLETIVNEPLREEGVTTTSGWVTHKQGGFPKVGDTIVIAAYQLRVEKMDGALVEKLKLTLTVPPEPTPPAEPEKKDAT